MRPSRPFSSLRRLDQIVLAGIKLAMGIGFVFSLALDKIERMLIPWKTNA